MTEGNSYYRPHNTKMAADYSVPVEDVDSFIDSALETAAGQDGWAGIPDLNDHVWNRIASDVENMVIDHARELVEDMEAQS